MKKIIILSLLTLFSCSTDDEPIVEQKIEPQQPIIRNCNCEVFFKNKFDNKIYSIKDVIVPCGESAFDTLNFYYNEGEFVSEDCTPIND